MTILLIFEITFDNKTALQIDIDWSTLIKYRSIQNMTPGSEEEVTKRV
jgi:hypothetical protein